MIPSDPGLTQKVEKIFQILDFRLFLSAECDEKGKQLGEKREFYLAKIIWSLSKADRPEKVKNLKMKI